MTVNQLLNILKSVPGDANITINGKPINVTDIVFEQKNGTEIYIRNNNGQQ